MAYHYSDPARESDPHAQPNVEVFEVTAESIQDEHREFYLGQAQFAAGDKGLPSDYIGYFYAFGFPGCLRDSDPIGPFSTEAAALADAREGTSDA